MIHFKSKSFQNKEESNKESEQTNSINEYVSTTVNQINSTNDSLNLSLVTGENLEKISSLFSEQDDNDKVINISKYDETLSYTDKNHKKIKKEKYNQQCENNDYGIALKNINNNKEDKFRNQLLIIPII